MIAPAVSTTPVGRQPLADGRHWLVALLALALAACGAVKRLEEPPRVSLVDIRPTQIHLFEQRYRVTLRVQNPNAARIGIRGMDFVIRLNDKLFAEGVSAEKVDVPAFGEALVNVELSSSLQRLFEQLEEWSRRPEQGIDYSIAGGVRIEGIPARVPFEREGRLRLPERGSGGASPGSTI